MGIKQILRKAANDDDIKELKKLNHILNIKKILKKKTDNEKKEIDKLIEDANVEKMYLTGEIEKKATEEVNNDKTLEDLLAKSNIKKVIKKEIKFKDFNGTLNEYIENKIIRTIIGNSTLCKSYKGCFGSKDIAKKLMNIKMGKEFKLEYLGSTVRNELYKYKTDKARAWLTILGPAYKDKSENNEKITKYLRDRVKKIRAKFIKDSFFEGPREMNSTEVNELVKGRNLWTFIKEEKIVDDKFLLILHEESDGTIRRKFLNILNEFFAAFKDKEGTEVKTEDLIVKKDIFKDFTSKKALKLLDMRMKEICKLGQEDIDNLAKAQEQFMGMKDEDEDEKLKNKRIVNEMREKVKELKLKGIKAFDDDLIKAKSYTDFKQTFDNMRDSIKEMNYKELDTLNKEVPKIEKILGNNKELKQKVEVIKQEIENKIEKKNQ